MSCTGERLGPGSMLIGDDVEAIALVAWPDLAAASVLLVGQHCGWVREELAGFEVPMVTAAEREQIHAAYSALS